MSASIGLTDALQAYLQANNAPEHPAMTRCRLEAERVRTTMQISAEQGAFMAFLVHLLGAKRTLEVGVYTGYSAMAVARALKAMHGAAARLVGFDASKEYTDQARTYWREAGVDDVIELGLGPARAGLDARLAAGEAGAYDFAFIDADKEPSRAYYERCLQLLRPGGVMAFDNALWSGRVADPAVTDADTEALRDINAFARDDSRVVSTLTALGDGLLLCTKR
jgi:caffeoyl-CoA O-methyltransferase